MGERYCLRGRRSVTARLRLLACLSPPHFSLPRRGERGSITILVAILLTALLGFGGLVIDFGHAATIHREAQNAADAATLAASFDLYEGNSETHASAVATQVEELHGFPAADLTLSFLDSSGNPTTDQYSVSTVKALVTDTIPTFLISIVGVSNVTVAGSASSQIGITPNGLCALCVLDPHAAGALTGTGSQQITVTGGGIAVDSDSATAATVTGGASITAPIIGVVGGNSESGGSSFSPTPKSISPIADPLDNVPVPTCPTGNSLGTGNVSSTQTISPGTYNNITATGQTTITLSAGVYCILGSFSATGNGVLQGSGVMLYFTCGTWPTATACTSGSTGGSFSLTGGAQYPISAPSSGAYKGLAVFYDRNNTADFTLTGGTGDQLSGTIYVKSGMVSLTGGSSTTQQFSMIICDRANLNGHTALNLQYNAGVDYQPKLLPVLTQ